MKKINQSEVLTREGGELEVSSAFRDVLAYFSSGTLMVVKSSQNDPLVSSFQARLELKGRTYTVKLVESNVLRQVYKGVNANTEEGSTSSDKVNDTQMMRSAGELLRHAVAIGASDIHITASKREQTTIQMRVQGSLEDYDKGQAFDYGRQLCRTFYQALSDGSATYNETIPQDARIGDPALLPSSLDGVRIGTTPLSDGTYMVLRLLYDSAAAEDLESSGLDVERHLPSINLMKARSSGINIICGPTGSGKSTTLQWILSQIIDETNGEKNIITVEDPVEYPICGKKTGKYAKQSSVASATTEDDRSIAMQQSIRAAMRLDPDIIMIGETRDTPSAQLSFRAAMTGHQVWTTLHTNSAIAAIPRLLDMGIPMSLVSDPGLISGIVFQRLVRKLCPHCKIKFMDGVEQGLVSQHHFERLRSVIRTDAAYVAKPRGCQHCNDRGTTGRTIVAEIVVPDIVLMRYIKNDDQVGAIEYWRTQGGRTVIEHTIEKVNKGLVDPFIAERQVDLLTIPGILADHKILQEEIRSAT